MPYAADFTPTYKAQIKAYWEAQIDSGYGGDASMKSQLNTYLNDISTAETNYKNLINDMNNSYLFLRLRWKLQFGLLNLYVLYQHCMEFPVSANLPEIPGMLIPLNTGESLIIDDDLRCFSTAWRYTWPGNGTTSYPWFSLSPGLVTEVIYAHSLGEATLMKYVFNSRTPYPYSTRYSNTDSYAIGNDNGAGVLAPVQDVYEDSYKFWHGQTPTFGFVDRMREFINYNGFTYHNYLRYRTGQTIMNYLAAGGTVTITQKPEEWMLANGGQELMDYFGWSDLSGNIL